MFKKKLNQKRELDDAKYIFAKQIFAKQILIWLVIVLFINLPLASALEISNVRAEEISQNSAVIKWETDQAANSLAEYGQSKDSLTRISDSSLVTNHQLRITGLATDKNHYFSVKSSNGVEEVTDNNGGELYSFKTLAPDTAAPNLLVEAPEMVQGNQVSITGKTELNAEVKIFINNILQRTAIAEAPRSSEESTEGTESEDSEEYSGQFSFDNIILTSDFLNVLHVEAKDASGNVASFNGAINSDTKRPILTLIPAPSLSEPIIVDKRNYIVKGTVNEASLVEIFLGERSLGKVEEATAFEKEVSLEEGTNTLRVVAKDPAGWEAVSEITIEADTENPKIKFELVSGTEYYEGRAETDITGQTKPGAKLYLYIFRGQQTEERANFQKALQQVTANDKGEFLFEDVSFPPPPFTSWTDLAPREVPPGLEDVLVAPLSQLEQEKRQSYRLYIITEDKLGRTAYGEKTVNINSCFSGQAFIIDPLVQMPYKLDPGLMEEGRENIQVVFNISYRGPGASLTNTRTGEIEAPYKITGKPRFEKACTQTMSESDDYSLGCKLLPNNLQATGNDQGTAYYVTADLMPAKEFVKRDDNLWDDFQKRQLKMPMRILINYNERQADGTWAPKTEFFCQDLGYFVDVPIKSSELVPDFLVDDVVPILNSTIVALESIKPYMDIALKVTGIGCIGSFLSKMVVRVVRIFITYFEPTTSKLSGGDCGKEGNNPKQLLMRETIDHWKELEGSIHPDKRSANFPVNLDSMPALEDVCPQTAAAWEFEAFVDQLYRGTCDRFFCRDVPAAWTSQATYQQVKNKIDEQAQCSSTANGQPLQVIENCNEWVKKNGRPGEAELVNPTNTCYINEGTTYVVSEAQPNVKQNIWVLEPVKGISKIGEIPKGNLLAYKPPESDNFLVAPEIDCQDMCERSPGYTATEDGWFSPLTTGASTKKSCYKETTEEGNIVLKGSTPNAVLTEGKYSAGYTKDCFIDSATAEKYRCVCKSNNEGIQPLAKGNARTALRKAAEVEEKWSYQQATLYRETGGQYGTYYPEWRYYGGRDFWGAFGLNYGLDNFNDNNDIDKMTTTRVNPREQTWSTFQTLCIRGINARIEMLKSILVSLRNCIIQAKTEGFVDAGLCKTIFTQYVCGLIYEGITALTSECSPLSMKNIGVNLDPDNLAAEALKSGFKAIPEAMSSSIEEVQSDYQDASLNQLFASGTQGFAESICLSAFGYEFPMGMDFIMDAANSFPSSTAVLFPIAARELSTYDPLRGTATYNYELGGTILPGCNLRGYRTYLKCIGPEDAKYPGIRQDGDCYAVSNFNTPFEGERTYPIKDGTSSKAIPRNQMLDLPIPSPQKISSNFRYDHVVIELMLAQGESAETCFDEGYRNGNNGIYYFPIREVDTPPTIECHVDAASGRFICPEIKGLFNSGKTYFENPFLRCYDSATDDYVKCNTPNMFVQEENDRVVIKPYLYLGGEGACLRITNQRRNEEITTGPIPLPSGINGPFSLPIDLGEITPTMLQGTGASTLSLRTGSSTGCEHPTPDGLPDSTQARQHRLLEFKYLFNTGTNEYELTVPSGVILQASSATDCSIDSSSRKLLCSTTPGTTSSSELTRDKINSLVFSIDGFNFHNVLGTAGNAAEASGQCTFEIIPGTSTTTSGGLSLKLELLKMPEAGCLRATELFPNSAQGRSVWTETVLVQDKAVEVKQAEGMHKDFLERRYDVVVEKAKGILALERKDLGDAVAAYYWVAAMVMLHKDRSLVTPEEVKDSVKYFFERGYDGSVISAIEYQKMNTYLCCIAQDYDVKNSNQACSAVTCS